MCTSHEMPVLNGKIDGTGNVCIYQDFTASTIKVSLYNNTLAKMSIQVMFSDYLVWSELLY
jgi:hypothetical protein